MHAEIAAEVPRARVKREVGDLAAESRLFEQGRFQVHCAPATAIPWTLQELGRLREIAFRAEGEGTGSPRDIDRYDGHYLHLFVWDAQAELVVGAYRLGLTDQILARDGKAGLYTQSLFDLGDVLLEALDPAIELGRSFVRVEYQRDFAPLLLLWQGIGRLVGRLLRYPVLFGAVSISRHYESASRELIVRYLTATTIEPDLAREVRPRCPLAAFEVPSPTSWRGAEPASIDDLSRIVAAIERDRKGVPVLLRQYLKCGGRLLGFSTDESFSGVLDGLVMVDLRRADPRLLARYMGQAAAADFLARHTVIAGRPATLPQAQAQTHRQHRRRGGGLRAQSAPPTLR